MKEIRVALSLQEYSDIKSKADQLGISFRQLVHNRVTGIDPENTPFNLAKRLSEEISACRRDINRIIQRETRSELGLYEDDIIRLDLRMAELEGIVTAFVGTALRQVKRSGNSNI